MTPSLLNWQDGVPNPHNSINSQIPDIQTVSHINPKQCRRRFVYKMAGLISKNRWYSVRASICCISWSVLTLNKNSIIANLQNLICKRKGTRVNEKCQYMMALLIERRKEITRTVQRNEAVSLRATRETGNFLVQYHKPLHYSYLRTSGTRLVPS